MRRPQIWLEVTQLIVTKNKTGIGAYTEELIRHTVRPDAFDYTLVGNVVFSATPQEIPNLPFAKRRYSRIFPGKVWNQLFKRGLMPPLNWIIPGRPDVVVNFNFVRYPLSRNIRSVTVIHDLAYLTFPEYVQAENLAYLRKFVPRAIAGSDHILTISESSRQDLIDHYDVDPTTISVAYPGVDTERFAPRDVEASFYRRNNLPERYFLFLSTLEPRKNVTGLIRAYKALPASIRRDFALVLAGGRGWLSEEIDAAIEAGDEVGRIIRTGYVSEEDRPLYYNGATAFVFPSHYEGFGIALIEAMASGTPVITYDNSSLHEVVGDAAIVVANGDEAGVTQAMIAVATDAARRKELMQRGLKRAKVFSWAVAGDVLHKVVVDLATTKLN